MSMTILVVFGTISTDVAVTLVVVLDLASENRSRVSEMEDDPNAIAERVKEALVNSRYEVYRDPPLALLDLLVKCSLHRLFSFCQRDEKEKPTERSGLRIQDSECLSSRMKY